MEIERENSSVASNRRSSSINYSSGHSFLKAAPTADFSSTFDYVIVFPLEGANKDQQTDVCKHAMLAMIQSGFQIYPYLSVQNDELICLLRLPYNVLKAYADKIDVKLEADPGVLERILKTGDPERRILPVFITDDPNITPLTPYEHIYLPFNGDQPEELYHVPPGEDSAFTKLVRLKLVLAFLKAPKRDGGCDLEIGKLIYKKKILAMYPLHEQSTVDQLVTLCTDRNTMPWDIPTHDLKEYFGEKIGLFFVFIGHYSFFLTIPAVIGLASQLVVWVELDFSHPILVFYSLILCIWSIFMLEFWKRQESRTSLIWGMTDFEKLELERPEFDGVLIKSFINGKDITYYPEEQLKALAAVSRTVITIFVSLMLIVVAGIYWFRFYLQERNDTSAYASVVASIMNTIQITIFNIIYQQLAIKLTDKENHRTDTMYEDSLIVKLFVFQFINSFASFFFLAFIATHLDKPSNAPDDWLGQCGATNCMVPLSINLALIFGAELIVSNALSVLLPYIMFRMKMKEETKGIAEDKELTPAENDYLLMQFNPMLQMINAYAALAVQYGFTMLFSVALPCATFISLFNNYVKVKFESWKIFKLYQRPMPISAQDIGTWQSIFQIISVVAVVTNGGMICFTMDLLWDRFTLQGRVWVFLGFQWFLIFCQFVIQYIVPDEPEDVQIQLERMDFIMSKVIERIEDEDFGVELDVEEEGYDVPTDGGREGDGGGGRGCCGKRQSQRKKRAKKIIHGIEDFPTLQYPYTHVPSQWPTPLDYKSASIPANPKQEAAAARKAAQELNSYGTGSYTSKYAAVQKPPDDVVFENNPLKETRDTSL